jgi:hypothetical protein
MKGKDNRAHPREDTLMPFQVHRISGQETGDLNCRISLGGIVIEDWLPPPVKDERLNLWLNMLNAKIDYLTSFTFPRSEWANSMRVEPLNISGGGMSLIAREQFDMGEILAIRIVLHAYPAKILHLYGEVVRIESTPENPDRFVIGIKFVGMSEEVRNEIIKFDFKKHKKRPLRKKSS